MRSWTKTSITTAMFALSLAPAASAGTPFTVIAEPGAHGERVAVDRAGDAHVIWVSNQPGDPTWDDRLRYCKIPRTARGCASPQTLWPGPDSTVTFSNARVFVTRANAVIVVADIGNDSSLPTRDTYRFRSSTPDGSFESGPTRIAPGIYRSAALGPTVAGETVSFFGSREYFEGPSPLTDGADLTQSFSSVPGGQEEVVAATPGGTRLVVSSGGSPSRVEFNRYDGSGDPNADINWSGPLAVGPGSEPMVAAGPQGAVLVSGVNLGGARGHQYQARKYNGSTFGPARGVSDISLGSPPIFPDLFANAETGQFHFTFRDRHRDLRWTTSPDGVNWSRQHLIARRADLRARPADVAAGPGGTGLAVWDGNPVGGSPDATDQIHAVRLEPIPEGGGGGTGGGTAGTGGGGSTGAAGGGSAPAACSILRLGTAGSDVITGTLGGDRIFAGTGNDRVDGLAGDDCLSLGGGDDRGQGGSGADRVTGGLGADRIAGGFGADSLYGDSGRDRLSGGFDNDRIVGGAGNDRLFGSFGNDRLHGASGRDRISGGRGRDRINGGRRGDRLYGDSSRDRINGDSGSDRIDGGSSGDRLRGNSGNDRIVGRSGRDRISGGSGNDRIRARDGRRDRVSCGRGFDRVLADREDVLSGCERVSRR